MIPDEDAIVESKKNGRETLTFDDIDIGNVGDIPTTYGGVQWLSMFAMDTQDYYGGNRHSGFVRGTTSGEQVAYLHTIGSITTINGRGTMTFVGAKLTAGNDLSLVVDVYGYHDNVVMYHQTLTLNDKHPLNFAPGWTGVDYIYFHTGAETPDPKSPSSGDYVVLDDVKLEAINPDGAASPTFAHVGPATFGGDLHHERFAPPALLHTDVAQLV